VNLNRNSPSCVMTSSITVPIPGRFISVNNWILLNLVEIIDRT